MISFNNVVKYLKDPKKTIKPLGDKGFFNWIPDKLYLRLVYWGEMGSKLNLKEPQTFTEKLQWLKIHNRKLEYTTYVDKYRVREYITAKLGSEYLIPLIGVYNNSDEISWESLPDKFVIKCNHGSGTNIICTNKSNLDIDETKNKLNKWMTKSWYWFGREWPYKNIEKKIIIEEFLQDEEQSVPKDYKFWIFNGKVKYINVHFIHNNKTYINIYNSEWKLQNYAMGHDQRDLNTRHTCETKHDEPENLSKMINFAEKLAGNQPFLRIDFYEVNSHIYFGEITFYPTSGFIKFYPNQEVLDEKYGSLVNLYIESLN